MDPLDLSFGKKPLGKGRKCLFGVTIAVIEDSRSASEAIQLLGGALGARIRRAQSVETAERHLASYRPNIVLIDMGLPDGSGMDLIKKIASAPEPRPGIVAMSGSDPDEWTDAARAAGADAVLPKPIQGVMGFAETMLSVLPDGESRREGLKPRQPDAAKSLDAITTDLTFLKDRLFEAVTEEDLDGIRYCTQFLESVARQTGDQDLWNALEPMRKAAGAESLGAGARLVVMLANRLGEGKGSTTQGDQREAG